MKPSVKVLFLNTVRRLIDCGVLLCLGRQPDVIILAELTYDTARPRSLRVGILNFLCIGTLAAQAERITPLGDLTDFAELAG